MTRAKLAPSTIEPENRTIIDATPHTFQEEAARTGFLKGPPRLLDPEVLCFPCFFGACSRTKMLTYPLWSPVARNSPAWSKLRDVMESSPSSPTKVIKNYKKSIEFTNALLVWGKSSEAKYEDNEPSGLSAGRVLTRRQSKLRQIVEWDPWDLSIMPCAFMLAIRSINNVRKWSYNHQTKDLSRPKTTKARPIAYLAFSQLAHLISSLVEFDTPWVSHLKFFKMKGT